MKRTALLSVKMLGSTERKEIKERMEDIRKVKRTILTKFDQLDEGTRYTEGG